MSDSVKSQVRRVSEKRTQASDQKSIKEEKDSQSSSPVDAEQPTQKRQNRRRRNKPKSSSPRELEVKHLEPETQIESTQPAPNPRPTQDRPRLDPEELSKKAWKIFLAEVSEEGVALISDNDAKELSRRCFRLAQIFLEQQNRQ